tara:strand:- start:1974 stop:2291 length:318 start_codon:yes stop_codon:yes gene_type:complete
MLSWNYYIRRKDLNVKAWLSSRNIRNYNTLCRTLESLGVEAPTLNEVSHYFKSETVKKSTKSAEPKNAAVPEPKSTAAPKLKRKVSGIAKKKSQAKVKKKTSTGM